MYRPVRWPDTPSSTPRQGRCWAMASLEGQHIRLEGRTDRFEEMGWMDKLTLGKWKWAKSHWGVGDIQTLGL